MIRYDEKGVEVIEFDNWIECFEWLYADGEETDLREACILERFMKMIKKYLFLIEIIKDIVLQNIFLKVRKRN